jgi:hypothetical protein
MKKQQWLVLAHCFNMDGRSASRLVTDRMPLLRSNGVEPVIISASTGSNLKEFEHHQIFSPAPSGLRFELRHILKHRKILRLIVGILLVPFYWVERLLIPLDSQWSWAITAYFRANKVVKKGGISVIYSSGGPISAHIAALLIRRKYHITWVCEFHDPIGLSEVHKRGRSRRIYDWLEKKICKKADRLIFTTKAARELAEKTYEISGSSHVIYAGEDSPATSNEQEISQKKKTLSIVHLGTLGGARNLDCFLPAVQKLLSEQNELGIEIFLYGTVDKQVKASIGNIGADSFVHYRGTIPHSGVGLAMKQSDILLLVHGEKGIVAETTIPAKVFEYLQSRRAVLALVQNNNELRSILVKAGAYVADANCLEDIAKLLGKCLLDYNNNCLKVVEGSEFTASGAVKKLIELARIS